MLGGLLRGRVPMSNLPIVVLIVVTVAAAIHSVILVIRYYRNLP